MSKTTELVERLRELPRDTRKATVEIYDLCIEASYEIEELTDRCARYAEEIAVLQEKQKWVDAGARQPEYGVPVLAVASGKKVNPRRVPRTQKDVDAAYDRGITEGLHRGIELMLYVLIDKHAAPMDDVQQLARELNHAAGCVAEGYVTWADIRQMLKEYEVEVVLE